MSEREKLRFLAPSILHVSLGGIKAVHARSVLSSVSVEMADRPVLKFQSKGAQVKYSSAIAKQMQAGGNSQQEPGPETVKILAW